MTASAMARAAAKPRQRPTSTETATAKPVPTASTTITTIIPVQQLHRRLKKDAPGGFGKWAGMGPIGRRESRLGFGKAVERGQEELGMDGR